MTKRVEKQQKPNKSKADEKNKKLDVAVAGVEENELNEEELEGVVGGLISGDDDLLIP